MTALCQDFLAVLLLYISLAMRLSNVWAGSANNKKISRIGVYISGHVMFQVTSDDVSDGSGICSRDGTRTSGSYTSCTPCHQETVGPCYVSLLFVMLCVICLLILNLFIINLLAYFDLIHTWK